MTREEWAERLPLIQAFVEGGTIQCRNKANSHFYLWVEVDDPVFDLGAYEYRIKPEPKVIWVNEYDDDELSVYTTEEDAKLMVAPQAIRKAVKYVEVVE